MCIVFAEILFPCFDFNVFAILVGFVNEPIDEQSKSRICSSISVLSIFLIPCIYAVVTNDTVSPAKEVMDFYEARGASENFNKEFKNDFDAGTLSHSQFDKNEMEFLISAMAYNLFHIYIYPQEELKASII